MSGAPGIDYNLSIFVRVPELWRHHDKGRAALIHFVSPDGPRRSLVLLDGRELWRFGVTGKEFYDDPDHVDADGLFDGIGGKRMPREFLSIRRWSARDVVADRYRQGRVFLAGDAAHSIIPTAASAEHRDGRCGRSRLEARGRARGLGRGGAAHSYETERRPVGVRNVRQAAENIAIKKARPPHPAIADDSAEGAAQRRFMGEAIRRDSLRNYVTDGTALDIATSARPFAGATERRPRPTASPTMSHRAVPARARRMPGSATGARRSICSGADLPSADWRCAARDRTRSHAAFRAAPRADGFVPIADPHRRPL